MKNSDWKQQINTFLELCEQRENFMRVRLIDELREEVGELQGKVRILEGKALDAEQDLALNKLGQMRASTRQEAIDRALNEGYNDGFRDGFKEGERRDI